ncbi:hypothetical protein GCM10009841_03640 [Microlunatus panaciterrae]|uniref:Rhodanese-related sulfurtransferase n=1 Tax=Microlunatus panaciterrae TaxID=400768 RepID=A0ABS2RLC9_9ACTN|nr:rhodanese-related sulfurtransferase [Microlunatus panaciterrae]
MSEINQTDFARTHCDGRSQVVDVREREEFASGHVPGARWIPMGQLTNRLAEIDRTQPVYVICATGGRSSAMTDVLRHHGFDARSVAGGTSAWMAAGRVIDYGTPEGH